MLQKAGYDCLDLSMFEMARDPNCIWNQDNWRETAKSRRAWADDHGIVFNQAHAPFSFNWADENVHKNVADPLVNRSIEIASILGAKLIVVHPLHWFAYKGYEAEARQMNLDYYRSLIPLAEKCNIEIGFENMWQKEVKRKCISDDVASRAADLASYIDEIDSKYIRACLDVGHCSLVGEEAEDAIRILGADRLHALHVHDNSYTGDDHTLPFLGKMNWDEIMKALKDIGYTGELTYEADGFLRNMPNDYMQQAANFMAQTGRFLLSKIQ